MKLPRPRWRNSEHDHGNINEHRTPSLLRETSLLVTVGSHDLGVVVTGLHPGMGLPCPALLLRVAAIYPTLLDAAIASLRPLGNRRPPAEIPDAEGHLAGLRQLQTIPRQ